MLTFRQLLAVSGQSSANGLVQSFGLHPLSMSSVIAAYEQQRRVYFVNLISPRILLSDEVQSFDDLVRLSTGPLGQPDQSEVNAFAQYLETCGVYLRYVSSDLRRAAIVGDVPALVNVHTAPVDDGSFVAIKDNKGIVEFASGTAIVAGILMTMAAVPEPASPGLFVVGASLGLFAGSILIIEGIKDDSKENQPAPPTQKPSSENTDVPNDTGDPDSGNIEVPNALAVGDPDNGIDADGLVEQLATSALDDVIDDIPIGWDSDAGVPLPGIGDGDIGGSGGGDAGGTVPGWA
jgi:hypothetical protein